MRDKTQMRDGQEDGRDNVKSKESQFEKGGTKEDESEAKDSSQDKVKDQEEERYTCANPEGGQGSGPPPPWKITKI